MKKTIRTIALVLALTMLTVTLAACGVTMDEAEGTYVGSYVYDGNDFTVAIVLTDDGTYAKVTMKNGEMSGAESGDYEIKGTKVRLYDDSAITYHGKCTEYKYKKGTLTNNGHTFSKE